MHLGQDLRYALRAIRRDPAFSALVIATLAFAIGANTAIFSVVNGVLLEPLGYRQESRLVAIHEVIPRFAHIAPRIPVNAMHFLDWRKSVHAFSALAIVGGTKFNLTGSGEPQRITAARVTPSLFPMLGARTELGRTFRDDEDMPGRDNVVVLSDSIWRRSFGADRSILGREIQLDGKPYEVVGVLAPGFHFPKLSQLYAMTISEERPELWKPFGLKPSELEPMGDFNYACIGALRPGVTLGQALAELNAEQARLAAQVPEKIEMLAALVPLRAQITGRSRSGLELLLGAVGLVLLIGCVNIANLLLARSTARKRELAVRSALGAGLRRLLGQILTESLLLAALGGTAGVALAYFGLRLILSRAPLDLPRLEEVHLDAHVLAFTIAISLAAGLLSGVLPAWRLARVDPQETLRAGARGATSGRDAGRLRSTLVALEVALSALCLVAGGLLLRSFINLLHVDKGFTSERVVTVNLNLPDSRYPDQPQRIRFTRTLLSGVEALPGVTSAGISNMLPLSGEGGNNLLGVEGTNLPMVERPLADIRGVNPEYFETLGIPLRRGRFFADSDQGTLVAVISSLTAARAFPGRDAIGKRFRIGDPDGPLVQVIGIAGDVRTVTLDKPPSLTVYVPYWQRGAFGGPSLAVRTSVDPASLAPQLRRVIHSLDPELPIGQFETMQQVVDSSVAQRRFQMNLILIFGLAALILSSLGIYGVVSYSIALRTNELGIRIALGARASTILGMILRQAMLPVAAGLAAGLLIALAAGRLLAGMLFGVRPVDPLTIAAVTVTLSLVAAAASLIPAFRATRVDPLTAVRYE